MKPLDRILQNLMKRSGEVGTVYAGTKLVTTVQPKTNTKTSDFVLPAGIYIITANVVSWGADSKDFAAATIKIPGGKNGTILAANRGDMDKNGGISLSVIANFDKETEVYMESYHEYTTAIGIAYKLQAIRIK